MCLDWSVDLQSGSHASCPSQLSYPQLSYPAGRTQWPSHPQAGQGDDKFYEPLEDHSWPSCAEPCSLSRADNTANTEAESIGSRGKALYQCSGSHTQRTLVLKQLSRQDLPTVTFWHTTDLGVNVCGSEEPTGNLIIPFHLSVKDQYTKTPHKCRKQV